MTIITDSDEVLVKLRLLHPDVKVPKRATVGSAGLDLEANEEVVLKPFARAKVGTGISMSLPHGYEAQVRTRSGLAFNHGVVVLNSPATVDCDYRGEIGVILINLGEEDFVVVKGMRIAQMIIAKVAPTRIEVVFGELDSTERGTGGFGSTGLYQVK